MNPPPPIPVIPLQYAQPPMDPRSRRWLAAARWSLLTAAMVIVVGLIMIPAWNTETVVATGPVLFVAGATLLVASLKIRVPLGAILGLAHCAVPLLFTMLVNVRRWSPGEATLPFLLMGGAYLIGVTLPLSVMLFPRMRPVAADAAPEAHLPSAGPVAEDRV